jgi:urease accessory protein
VIVRAGAQRWLRVRPATASAALELGYHAGNLHWRVRFDGSDLLIALEGPADTYAARIEPMVSAGQVTLSEESE